MLYIGSNSKKKKFVLLISLTTVKQSINNAKSCFDKKINKATHGYSIPLALQSNGDMQYVGSTTKSKKKKFCSFIYQR